MPRCWRNPVMRLRALWAIAKQDTFRTGAAMTQRTVTILGGSIDVVPVSNDRLEIEGKTYSISRVVHDFTESIFECYVG